MPPPPITLRAFAKSLRLVPLLGLLAACDSVTGPYGAALVLSVDRKEYQATATPLSATTGYLTRYDVTVGIRLENRGASAIALDRCDGSLVVLLAPASRTDAEVAEDIVSSMGFWCETLDVTAIQAGETVSVRLAYSGYSSDPAFMDMVGEPLQFVLGTRAGVLRSPAFRIKLPPVPE